MTTTTFNNGVQIINCTPHAINFLDGETKVTVQPSGILLNARAIEKTVQETPVQLVSTIFVGDEAGRQQIKDLKGQFPNALLVGSIISAQAYPGDVVGMTPAPGFERVDVSQKLMSTQKFSTFPKVQIADRLAALVADLETEFNSPDGCDRPAVYILQDLKEILKDN